MTRSQLRSLARDYLQEAGTVPVTDAILNDLLTQGEETLADLAEYAIAKFTETFVLNDIDYELPSDLLTIYSVAWNNTDGNLVSIPGPMSLQRMNEEFIDWRTDVAGRPERWLVIGNALIVHPKPDATYAGTTLEIYGSATPTPMAGDSNEPTDLPKRFHRTLAKYAALKWCEIDKENAAAQKLAAYLRAEFGADAQRLRQVILGRETTDGMEPGLRVAYARDSVPVGALVDPEDR